MTDFPHPSFEAWLPPEMAERASNVGVKKAQLSGLKLLLLSVLAGAFIAIGAAFMTTVTAVAIPYGVSRLLGGLVFCVGLILVVVAGAELFTGNNLIVMAWASGKLKARDVVKNWIWVFTGNFIGALLTVLLIFWGRQYMNGGGAVGANALRIAAAKVQLDPIQAFVLGVLCNALVCMAVWLCFSARTTTDKILSIIFPITAFVAMGFEHSVANMYFIPMGLLIEGFAPMEFFEKIGETRDAFSSLSWTAFIVRNLIPVTLGNIIGGAGLVGLVYWFIYLKPSTK